MSYSIVPYSAGDSVQAHATSATISHSTTAGNLLIVVVGSTATSSIPTITVSDSGGNTWNSQLPSTGSDNITQVFYSKITTGGNLTITINYSVTCYLTATVIEASGEGSSPFDQITSVVTGLVNNPSTPSLTPTLDGSLCIGFMVHSFNNGSTIDPGAGWTNFYENDSQALQSSSVITQVQTTKTAVAANWTFGSGNVDANNALLVIFSPVAATPNYVRVSQEGLLVTNVGTPKARVSQEGLLVTNVGTPKARVGQEGLLVIFPIVRLLSASPSSVTVNSTLNSVILTGIYTSWNSSSPTFTTSSGTITGQSIISDTSAIITYDAPAIITTAIITDPSTGSTTTITIVAVGGGNAIRWYKRGRIRTLGKSF